MNKEILQEYNNRLNSTNSGLSSILDTINKLPEAPNLQDKIIEITENGTTTVSPDEEHNGLGQVEIFTNIPPKKYAPKYIRFQECTETSLNEEIQNLDTSNMTTMRNLFYKCSGLTELDLRHFNTSNVTDMYQMFDSCKNLTRVDLSGWDTSKTKNFSCMFYECTKLMYVDMRTLDLTTAINTNYMFSSVPNNCLIIVKNDANRDWIKSKINNNLTNIKTVAEL